MKKTTKKIYITELDKQRLTELVNTFTSADTKDAENLLLLRQELERANIVKSQKVAATVVTMNSRVKLIDLDTGAEKTFQIVYPWQSDVEEGKISVLAPIGTALLGYKKGDTVVWKVPSGFRRLKIEEILYQPEANGNFEE